MYFLRDGNNEAQIGFDHFLLRNARFALALLHHVDDAAEFTQATCRSIRGNVGYFGANALNRLRLRSSANAVHFLSTIAETSASQFSSSSRPI